MSRALRKSPGWLIILVGGLAVMHVDIHKLVDFALGRLSSEESLAVLEQIENDPQLSEDLEFIITILNITLPNRPSGGSRELDPK
jgi:hypothetical protein